MTEGDERTDDDTGTADHETSKSAGGSALETPDLDATRASVEGGLERGELVVVFGRCTVEYDGRAASRLGPGDRLIVLKPDGTTLVHTHTGQQPVNWQPPGSTHDLRVVDGAFELLTSRRTPAEELLVRFERVEQVSTFEPGDTDELAVSGTEADLRRRILDEPDLIEPGFTPLSIERDTPAGAIDIYGTDAEGTAVVVELKRRRVGPAAVGQLSRYVSALRRERHVDAQIRGVLVAPSVTDRARQLLIEENLEFVQLEPG